jgi:cytochrome c oxidase subunit 2
MRRIGGGAVLVGCGLLAAGCGKQSIVSPKAPIAHSISVLWWWMLGAAAVVFFGAVALLLVAWLRRRTPGLPLLGEREDISGGLVLLFGIAVPVVALVALFALSDVYLVGQSSPPDPRDTAMTIDVIGHQWWWEVRYPQSAAVTANEIHIPTGTRVNVVATTADVIHSFWVPELNRKVDMVPGFQNRVLLYAPHAGVYRGQCSQFCGLQHAHMALSVIAQPPEQFAAWLRHEAAPAARRITAQAHVGRHAFMTSSCGSCHEIRGTAARGTVGPDLTHLEARTTLAADTIPNVPSELAAWIANPQAIKPGDRMPDLGLSRGVLDAVVTYLESLR